MTPLSPGLAQGCFALIDLIGRQALAAEEVLTAFGQLGSAPSSTVLEMSQALDWISLGLDGRLAATPRGERLFAQAGYAPMLRQALLDYVETIRPPWLQNASYGRARVLAFVGPEIGQVLVEADLTTGHDQALVDFWDRLAALARGQHDDRMLAIGRVGERLSLRHEAERTGRSPKWVSIESNDDGYDVLSIASRDDAKPLTIEVKTSTVGLAGVFHLTRREWRRATSPGDHRFHLWDVTGPAPRLAVVSTEDVLPHAPVNLGKGSWSAFEVPFSPFAAWFTSCE